MTHPVRFFVVLLFGGAAIGASDAREDAPVASSPEPNPGIAILKKTDAATKSVKSVTYRAKFYSTGWLTKQLPTVEGTAAISGRHDQHFLNARFDATVRYAFTDGTHRLTYLADGSKFTLIDWDHKTTYSHKNPNVTGHGGRAAERLGMREFVMPEPFSDEIHAETVVRLPDELVGNEWCHVIDVVYRKNLEHAVWFVSTKDFLPRRVDRIVESLKRGTSTMHTILTDLKIEPDVLPEALQVIVPDDFKAVEHFAPDIYRAAS